MDIIYQQKESATLHLPPDDRVLGLSKGFVSAKQLKKRISTFYKYYECGIYGDGG